MYVYFFGYQNDGVLYSMKVDNAVVVTLKGKNSLICCVKPEDITVPYSNLKLLTKHVDPRFDGFKMFNAPEKEGEVYHRTFWLKEHDRVRASKIVSEYTKETEAKKTKPTHAQQIERLKDKISEFEAENKRLQQIISDGKKYKLIRYIHEWDDPVELGEFDSIDEAKKAGRADMDKVFSGRWFTTMEEWKETSYGLKNEALHGDDDYIYVITRKEEKK